MTDALAGAVAAVNRRLAAHAGAVEVTAAGEDGVTVRFTGMCTGCAFRPTTFGALVAPLLSAVPGVREMRAEGVRVSPHAARRMAALLGPEGA
ncbi:NifU family protein [Dactylosporangium siamense]|uniref:NIF system FeS cluster assembly NifU C-terminal domain-containing protein n=1 Tax=Dactylosporangium siamense TaxID=685454 RepID=A0A919U4W2_9ACTN|nr:NifU family protein [Dactylosporangium siamense]GIG42579.1 hypothetical protein Dsi01nite_006200 [Dactylosporangium siamense]